MTFEKTYGRLREAGLIKKIHDIREKTNEIFSELEKPETSDERIEEIYRMMFPDGEGCCEETFETKYCPPACGDE